MLGIIKRVIWDLRDQTCRFNYNCSIWRNFPGRAGELIRARLIPRSFAEVGRNILIQEGVRFLNAHQLKVGDDCALGYDNFLQAAGGITLGNGVVLGPGVKIWSVNHSFQDLDIPIPQQESVKEEVVIGDGCWLAANVFVMPGVRLPEGCVVSAGSIVAKKDYPPYSILAGSPIRVIGSRKLNEETQNNQ